MIESIEFQMRSQRIALLHSESLSKLIANDVMVSIERYKPSRKEIKAMRIIKRGK